MYKTIVVGTDLSPSATKAVEHAAEMARLSDATLHLVCVYKAMSTAVASTSLEAVAYGGDAMLDADNELANEVGKRLQRVQEDLADRGVATVIYALTGDPSDALIAVAEQEGADLIVVGNKGMGGVKRFVLGSVPNKISHNAPCSVLIVDTQDA